MSSRRPEFEARREGGVAIYANPVRLNVYENLLMGEGEEFTMETSYESSGGCEPEVGSMSID
jgi:hypothetical protein